jgi:hypothetical protein
MMASVIGPVAMNTVVSNLDGVVAAVAKEDDGIGRIAQERLNDHRDTGDAQIEVTRGDVDSFVSLVDKNCLSIEFGHYTPNKKKYVAGLYIVSGAAGLV